MLQTLFRRVNAVAKQGSRKRPFFELTSGYFSLYQPYQKIILGSRSVDCRIVAASPKVSVVYAFVRVSGHSAMIFRPMVFSVQKAYLEGYQRATRTLKNVSCGQSVEPGDCGKKLLQGTSKAFNYGSGINQLGHITPKVIFCHIRIWLI